MSADFDRILRKKAPNPDKPSVVGKDKSQPEPKDQAKPGEVPAPSQARDQSQPADQTDAANPDVEGEAAHDDHPADQSDSIKQSDRQSAGSASAQPANGEPVDPSEQEKPAEAAQPQLSAPSQLADTRPVTIRSLNLLLLQGARTSSPVSAAARDAAASPKPAAAAPAHPQADRCGPRDTTSARPGSRNEPSDSDRPGDKPLPSAPPSVQASTPEQATSDTRTTQQSSAVPVAAKSSPDPSMAAAAAGTTPQPACSQATPKPAALPSLARSADPLAALSKSGGELAGIRSGGVAPARTTPILRTESAPPGKPANQEQAFAAQLMRGVAAAMKQGGGGGSVTIRLNPESLGHLKIQIQLPQSESGRVVSARFEASNQDAKDMLEHSFAGLRDSLESRGLTVGTLESTLSRPQPEAAQISAGTPNAEVALDRHPLDAPARQDSSTPDDHTAGYDAGNGGTHGDPWSGQDARHDGNHGAREFVHAESLDAAARSAGLIASMGGTVGDWGDGGGLDLGRSPGFYRTNSTDGGAVRVVVDAVA